MELVPVLARVLALARVLVLARVPVLARVQVPVLEEEVSPAKQMQ